MSEKKLVIDTNLGLVDYVQTVNDIVLEYFSIDGSYQPHIGILNTMRLFYNLCVKESSFDNEYGHDIIDAMEMVDIISDENFIKQFNDNLTNCEIIKLDFGNAYRDAMKIVDYKKSSLENAINMVQNSLTNFVTSLSETINDKDIKTITDIAEKISSGNINSDTIVEAYGNSKLFNELTNKPE